MRCCTQQKYKGFEVGTVGCFVNEGVGFKVGNVVGCVIGDIRVGRWLLLCCEETLAILSMLSSAVLSAVLCA